MGGARHAGPSGRRLCARARTCLAGVRLFPRRGRRICRFRCVEGRAGSRHRGARGRRNGRCRSGAGGIGAPTRRDILGLGTICILGSLGDSATPYSFLEATVQTTQPLLHQVACQSLILDDGWFLRRRLREVVEGGQGVGPAGGGMNQIEGLRQLLPVPARLGGGYGRRIGGYRSSAGAWGELGGRGDRSGRRPVGGVVLIRHREYSGIVALSADMAGLCPVGGDPARSCVKLGVGPRGAISAVR